MVLTDFGINTFKLGGWCPRVPFLFLPHVYNLPSAVIPADIDFPAFIYINRWFFRLCGNDKFVYWPSPSSPFLPEPHTHA
jgi:hypothetical protein